MIIGEQKQMRLLKSMYDLLLGTWPRRVCTTGALAAAGLAALYLATGEAIKTRPGYGSAYGDGGAQRRPMPFPGTEL
jgi:hypothetical protein